MPEDPLQRLYRRPGFMIRRAHQIAVSLFMEEMQGLKITKTQYGVLFILKHRPGVNQISVAKLLGLDRSTAGMVVKKLADAGLVSWDAETGDLRQRSLNLTAAGEDMLRRLAEPVRRAERRVLAAFDEEEQAQFLALLDKFTRTFNGVSRVPVLATERSAKDMADHPPRRKRRNHEAARG
ncbi:MAG TPA: MarR family transcriptional regulator [Alphaproteobacteria bacterium]|nr:MarR family transcriptional regulator [Alphaproteobacteria bacterium]